MKKMISFVLALTMALSMAACKAADSGKEIAPSPAVEETKQPEASAEPTAETPAAEGEMTGAWQSVTDGSMPQEAVDALNKALEGLTGAAYEPVRLLATQTVAGTNYAILCRTTVVVPDAQPSYTIAYVYEDLDKNAELVRVQDLISTEGEAVEGGFVPVNDEEAIPAALAALDKATEELTGATYELTAIVGTQVVAGTNTKLLCIVTPVVPDAVPSYCLVTIHEDLDGNAEILEVEDLVFSLQEEAAAQ